MSVEERPVADTAGRVAILPAEGGSLQQLSWTDARIRLSTKRLLIETESGRKTVPLEAIQDIGDPFDGAQAVASVAGYVGLYLDESVLLVAPEQRDDFVFDLHTARIDGRFCLARYPAMEGGVPTDQPWEDARLAITDRSLRITTERGAQTTVPLDEVGPVLVTEQSVQGKDRTVVKVIHEEENTVVQTVLSGPADLCRFVESFLRIGTRANRPDVDLDRQEWEIVVAIYSGISPFRIPDFVDESVASVEETYEHLVERGVLTPVRRRLEVDVAPGGRILATETEPAEPEDEEETEEAGRKEAPDTDR